MKCPICEANTWTVHYRDEVNILSLVCISCGNITIDIDIKALNSDYEIRQPC